MPKIIIQIYGLFRMVLGVAQIVGLTSGFFIVEWIIRYPQGSLSFVFDQDILAIVYLAVLLRAVFHLVAGIGIAKLAEWVVGWLNFGWVVVLIIVGGLIHTQMAHWVEIGLAKDIWAILSWPKIFIYLGWVLFDYILVTSFILQYSQSSQTSNQEYLDGKKIGIVFFASIVFFVILLYLGKPIKQGFHQGYFRIKDSTSEPMIENEIKMENQDKVQKLLMDKKSIHQEDETKESELKLAEALEAKKNLPREMNVPETVPYRQTIGYVGALGVILGLCLQLVNIFYHRENKELFYSYQFLAAGFFLLLFYSIMDKLMPVAFLSFFGLTISIVNLVIIWFLRKKIQDEI